MKLIVETDIGHDPDDFFAITYLLAAGVDIRAILIYPGDVDQIAIVRFICRQLKLDIPIGKSNKASTKFTSGSIHHELLNRYGYSLIEESDGFGEDILQQVIKESCELFIIGPPYSVGRFLGKNKDFYFERATMQGGFVPYSVYRPLVTLDKFEQKEWMPSFNPNGDRKATELFLNAIIPRQIVGKNVCHTIEFTLDIFQSFKSKNRASELFSEAASIYFQSHSSKKFHDPTAAVCHLHPEIGLWHKGNMIKREAGWTTTPFGSDDILVDIDRDKLWSHLSFFT